ncbi:LacI family DNA-binding transcriptional regulator [Algibacter sp. AS12]|uniref:LacI family DNA-binding transcriptional regulator n=1 Tax=Algibacter sp. AS12 TaxID=3135773 RepID=UPI00398B2EC0
MKNRITLKDLAKDLNLSPSTISRALGNHPAISDATKKRVQKKADEKGFTPNSIASSFRMKKTRSLGVIVPRIDIHFHSLVISGIEDFAYKNNYNITIYQSKDALKREQEITKILQTRMVDGIISCLSIETTNCKHFKKFNKLGVPLVFYDRVPTDFDASKIVINDFESSFTATEHLIKSGCKRIGHIAGNQKTNIFKARLEGYKAALKSYDLPVDETLIMQTNSLSYDEGVACAKKYLSLPELPDGLFCANDYTAVSAIQVFRKNEIKIPRQVAIVGFSNYPISRIIEPNLTTVNDRAFQMGVASAKLLIRQIEDNNDIIDSEIITLKTELIIRESSRIG